MRPTEIEGNHEEKKQRKRDWNKSGEIRDMKEKRKNPSPWICYLWSSLDSAPMGPGCVGPGSPGRPSGAGQREPLSLPGPGQPDRPFRAEPHVACRAGPPSPGCSQRLGLLWVSLPGCHFLSCSPCPLGTWLWGEPVGGQHGWNRPVLGWSAAGRKGGGHLLSPAPQLCPARWHPTQLPQQEGEPPQNKNKSASPGSALAVPLALPGGLLPGSPASRGVPRTQVPAEGALILQPRAFPSREVTAGWSGASRPQVVEGPPCS